MPNIIPDESPGEYRVDIITGTKTTGTHHFTATDAEVENIARNIVVSLGGDAGDIYSNDGLGHATYYDTVVVE
ncbi:hypothetical protein AB0J77_14815 [Micromonospora tulbaghiae]|uniref:hypothetical protein n=1 Tax=Micromonospora tulbaghiae TaxID=479978 RepID=UPI0034371D25